MQTSTLQWLDHLDRTDSLQLIKNACVFATKHEKNNTPFSYSTLTQGLAMADALLALQSDDYSIAAAIAYPAVFYNHTLHEKCDQELDKTVCKLIFGALQMDIIHSARVDNDKNETGQQNQIDNLRKMMLAMVDDTRTILLKLSERLVMLQNLNRSATELQQKIAQDTLDYYAPLANRLGIGYLKWQLEDWAFRYLNPEEYKKISEAFHMRHNDRVKLIHEVIAEIKKLLADANIKNAKVAGRIKHIYSIYKKIQRKKTTFENIYDTNAVRILVPTITDCYTALSLVHAKWHAITEEFDDYIAKPKPNGYQSIHTAVMTLPGGIAHRDSSPVEIQIRTLDMHEKSELGIAAHWKYKENKSVHAADEEKILLLRELLETQTHLYPDAFHDRVYVFSPAGNVFDLPKGATPLDFAYLVHSDIGNRCRGAKINGALVPLTYQLQTGDHIDILTTKEGRPSQDWLRADFGYLTTAHAKQKVRQWFRKQNYEKHLAEGTTIWEKVARQHHYEKSDIEKVVAAFNLKNTDSLLAALGSGQIGIQVVLHKIDSLHKKAETKDEVEIQEHQGLEKKVGTNDFSVLGAKHLLTQLAKCCNPIPGDEIIGYITKGRGISVHQKKCRNVIEAKKTRSEKLIDISWEKQLAKHYGVNLEIQCEDRSGLIHDISSVISKLNLSISSIYSRVNTNNRMATINITIKVSNIDLLDDVIKKLRQVKSVVEVKRK